MNESFLSHEDVKIEHNQHHDHTGTTTLNGCSLKTACDVQILGCSL